MVVMVIFIIINTYDVANGGNTNDDITNNYDDAT